MDNPIQELIQNAIDANYNAANNNFGSIINSKISDVMQLERERIANQIYNNVPDKTDNGDNEVPELSAETPEGSEERDPDTETEVSDEEEEEEEYSDDDITDEEIDDALDQLEDDDEQEEE